MNYLRHLNGFFERLDEDERLSSYHISLYLALFRQWNASRFREQFVISRTETMILARIGSANTYARCMKELAQWGYIRYNPSSNLHSGSTVSCVCFDSEEETVSSTESDTGKPDKNSDNPSVAFSGLPAGTKCDTGTDTASDTTTDTGTCCGTENDTSRNTASDTSIETDTAPDTGDDTTTDTGTSSNIETDTATDTTGDTSTACDLKTDTASDTGDRKKSPADTKSDTGTDTASDTLLINNTNKNKQEENQKKKSYGKGIGKKGDEKVKENQKNDVEGKDGIPDFSQVSSFFRESGFPESGASQFYARYQSAGWKTGNNQPVRSWQALARKWMTNNQKNKSHERTFNQIGPGRFGVTTDKDYSEPL